MEATVWILKLIDRLIELALDSKNQSRCYKWIIAYSVFDSGLGGLTVLKEIMKITPNENIVYFGDTAKFLMT